MIIRYGRSVDAYRGFKSYVEKLIRDNGCKRILEVGAGANPTLPIDYVLAHNLDYAILDVSQEELDKAPDGYQKIQADIAGPDLNIGFRFDFVFSRMIAEHVKDGRAFHRQINRLLDNNGIAFHYFPTLYDLPYLVNLIIPEKLAYRLLLRIDSGRRNDGNFGKFPAYYDMCYGPILRQIGKLEEMGFSVVEYAGFFGNDYYYKGNEKVLRLHQRITEYLINHPHPLLTSYAYLVMRKAYTV